VTAHGGTGALFAACACVAALTAAPAAAKTRFFPLPLYTTVPNEGSTYGAMPVFLRLDENSEWVRSITAPSASWNSSAGVTVTYRYYRFLGLLHSWHLLLSASTTINRSVWFTYDDDRRTPGKLTKNVLVRVRRNLFYRYFGLGPDTTPEGESSYTRLYAIASARGGWNATSRLNLGTWAELRADALERHTIEGLPATQDVYPDAPGLGGAAFVRAGLVLRYDTRLHGDYSESGFATELSAGFAQGITGVSRFGQVTWTARVLVPEASFLKGAARVYWTQVIGADDVPFYNRASLGGDLLFRGFQENRFVDMGAWLVEAEQRFALFQTRIFGVVADWRIDPFISAGQVYGEASPWSHVRVAAGVGLRMWIRPDILGRIDLAYAGEGLRAYVVLGYPF
jgi:hypothetical protein